MGAQPALRTSPQTKSSPSSRNRPERAQRRFELNQTVASSKNGSPAVRSGGTRRGRAPRRSRAVGQRDAALCVTLLSSVTSSSEKFTDAAYHSNARKFGIDAQTSVEASVPIGPAERLPLRGRSLPRRRARTRQSDWRRTDWQAHGCTSFPSAFEVRGSGSIIPFAIRQPASSPVRRV